MLYASLFNEKCEAINKFNTGVNLEIRRETDGPRHLKGD